MEPVATAVPQRQWRRRLVVVLAAVAVLLVLAAAWLALQVSRARDAMADAQARVDALADIVERRDLSTLRDELPALQADLHRARSAADDPVWRAALPLPWLGDQLGAARTVAVSLDDLTAAGGRLLDAVDTATSGGDDTSGAIDLTPFVAAMPVLTASGGEMLDAVNAIAAIDTDGLVDPLAEPIAKLQDQLEPAAGMLETGTRVAAVLPAMLGDDEPRTYLLAFLNSAELRAQGGIVGAVATLRVQDGAVALTEHRAASPMGALDESVVPLTDDELAVHSDRLGRWAQDAMLTPDFPRAAEILAARWAMETAQGVDGVVAIDTAAMPSLLRATGPLTVAGERLDSRNVIKSLLADAYARLEDPAATDTFFGDVAAGLFGAVAQSGDNRPRLAAAIAEAAGEGRVRVWSAHLDEQATLAGEQVGGAFLSGPFPDAVGVFLDDGTAAKLDYYLRTTVAVESLRCDAPEPSATVRIDLSYAPPGDVLGLPAYVLGAPPNHLAAGWVQTNLSIYGPVGADLPSPAVGDAFVGGERYEVSGRVARVITSRLAPGDSVTVRAEVPVTNGEVTVWSTPTLTSPGWLSVACPTG